MAVVEWSRERAVSVVDPSALDDLDGHVLVVDGATEDDDPRLGWVRRAPCVVIGRVAPGAPAPAAADVVVTAGEEDVLASLVARCIERPHASRCLVDVLRPMPTLDVATGLALESLAYSTLLAGPEFAAWLRARPRRHRPPPAGPPLRSERHGSVLHVTLSRPEVRNALGADVRDALVEALAVAVVDEGVTGVVLAGDGPAFSSGGHLDEFGTAPNVVRAHEVRTYRSVGAVLASLRPRVTALVQGPCVGGGVELAAFAGRVVADPAATFRLPELDLGLVPGAGGTVSLTRRIGRQATARLVLLGRAVTATEALRLGLVDEVAPVDQPAS